MEAANNCSLTYGRF